MDKSSIWAVGSVVAISTLAVAVAHRYTAEAHEPLPTPFSLGGALDRASVTLADGRNLELHEGAFEIAGKHIALSSPRRFASLTVMPTGQVLVWGGIDNEGRLIETGEWFEPSTGALVTTGRLGLPPRAGHTLNVLSDGTLAMTGGWGEGNVPAHDVALWRPLDRHLEIVAGDMARVRLKAEASLQADGTLQVSGGIDEIGRPVRDVWRFGHADPAVAKPHGVVASYPTKDNHGASPIGPLALRFSEPVDVAHLGGTVSLLGPNGVVKTRVVGAEDGRLAFVQLPDELYPAARYTIFVQGLRTAKGDVVPYEAIGFTTKAARSGVVLAGEGQRPGTKAPSSTEPPLVVMAGAGKTAPCKPADAFHLCRDKGQVKDGAFYPGQDNVATSSGGHWRLYKDRQSLPDTAQLEANLPKGSTALIGQVRRIDESPVTNVEISVDGQKVRTDKQGVFVLQHMLPGRRELFVDGRPAGSANTEYGRFIVGADVTASTVNHMPFVMYLPRVLERDKIALPSPTTRETVLTHPDMPGLELRIPAGAVFKDRDGKVLNEIAIVPTPVDHAPFPLPDNFPMYFTIQPGDAVVQGMTPEAAKGIQVVYPNYGKQKAGDKADFWVYSAEKGWEMYGLGHASQDEKQLVADADTRLVWALGAGASVPTDDGAGGTRCGSVATPHPVDIRTGMFWHEWEEFNLPDTIPLVLKRAYRADDSRSRSFGIGSTTNYGMHLYSADGLNTVSVVLACGQGLPFRLTAGSPSWPLVGTVWTHKSSDSAMYGATLQFLMDGSSEGAHWILTTLDGSEYAFGRHVPNALTWIKDRNGNQTSFVYNGGLLDTVRSPNGRFVQFSYDGQNRITSVLDNISRRIAYEYDQSGHLSKAVYPDASYEKYDYDAAGHLTTMTDRRGTNWLTNTYDNVGRVSAQTFADGSQTSYAYSLNASNGEASTIVTMPTGRKHQYVFDAVNGDLTSDVNGLGTSSATKVSYQRQSSGKISAITDSLGRVTSRLFDQSGNISEVTYLSNTTSQVTRKYSYEAGTNRLLTATDVDGKVTSLTYSGNCLIGITNALRETSQRTCDASGRPVSLTDAEGRTNRLIYRGADLVAVFDAMGRSTSFVADAAGRTTSITSADGSVLTREFDVNDRVVKEVTAGGQQVARVYDANGNLTGLTLPNGARESYSYDSMNRLVQHTDPAGRAETWTYYADEKPAIYTDRDGKVTTYQYDGLDRLVATNYPDGAVRTVAYDLGGRRLSVSDSSGSVVSWTYGELDEVKTETTNDGTSSYTYDVAGRRTTTSVAGQEDVLYQYDATGRVSSIGRGSRTSGFTYDASGRRTGLLFPNGVQALYDYNAAGQLTGIDYHNATGGDLGEIAYKYGANAKLSSETNGFAEGLLPDATSGQRVYDQADRLTEASEGVLTYDSAGNLTHYGDKTFSWDAKGQLASVSNQNGTKVTYGYDALGRRTSVTDTSGERVVYVYDGLIPLAEKRSSGVTLAYPGATLDERIGWTDAVGEHFSLTDARGSTAAVVDVAGDIMERHSYEAYGSSFEDGQGAAISTRYLFTGRELDESGIYYFRNRYYVPELGRFISRDPIGYLSGQLNQYTYVDGDPVNSIDPLGTTSSLIGCLNPANAAACAAAGEIPASAGAAGTAGSAGTAGGTATGAVGGTVMGGVVIPRGESIPGTDFCPPGGDDPDRCYKNYEREAHRCERWYGMGPADDPNRWYRACLDRASDRRGLCLKGFLDDAPEPWGPGDMR